ncbi:MAG: twin-arginine translocase TatA/TatE family subunit [Micrococcales bacterium]|nr:twin-arginine translocase TatA/TatE family subunit [Micrococcales bacterium]
MARFFENPAVLIVLLLVIVLVFGANKLPTAARSLGQSLRIFKTEMRPGDKSDDKSDDAAAPAEEAVPGIIDQQTPASGNDKTS